MAFATKDFGWGEVQILYNGNPTQNLHMVRIELQNASPNDLENVRLDLITDPGTVVLRSQAAVRGSLQTLPFAPDYQAVVQRAIKVRLPQHEQDYWSARSPFLIPVLNRGTIIDMTLLVSRVDYATPQVTLGCDHKAARAVHEPFAAEHLGVREGLAQIVGVAVTFFVAGGAVLLGWSLWTVAVTAWVSGLTAMTIGALVVRAWRWLVSLVD